MFANLFAKFANRRLPASVIILFAGNSSVNLAGEHGTTCAITPLLRTLTLRRKFYSTRHSTTARPCARDDIPSAKLSSTLENYYFTPPAARAVRCSVCHSLRSTLEILLYPQPAANIPYILLSIRPCGTMCHYAITTYVNFTPYILQYGTLHSTLQATARAGRYSVCPI